MPDLIALLGSSLLGVVDQTVPVPVPEPSEAAIRFYQTGIGVWLFGLVWGFVFPLVLLATGWSARLRDLALRLGRRWFLALPIYALLYLVMEYLVDLPVNAAVGHYRLTLYGLSTQTWLQWLAKSLISLGVMIVTAGLLLWIPLLVLRKAPKRWWLYVGILTLPFGLFAASVKPIWIDPLFNRFGEMKDKTLEAKILAIAAQAGIEGSRIFEVDKSSETKTVNAYVTGFGSTKRIVLWDTLLKKLDEDEVLAVMAHEMGHYVRHHVLIGVGLSTLGSILVLYLVDRTGRAAIERFGPRLGFDSLSDLAAVPLLIVLLQLFNLMGSPISLAVGRAIEHDADRFALDQTRANHSAASAFVKLTYENLSFPRPHPLLKILRSTHPPIGERIDFCNNYHPWR